MLRHYRQFSVRLWQLKQFYRAAKYSEQRTEMIDTADREEYFAEIGKKYTSINNRKILDMHLSELKIFNTIFF